MKKTVFLTGAICILLFLNVCSAQTIKLVKATRQAWSGGVAGSHGYYYRIEFQTKLKNLTPDTVWINNMVYPADFSGKNGGYIRKVDSVTHEMTYSILIDEAHNDFRGPLKQQKNTPPEKPEHIRQFQGVAMISYELKHKQHFYIIKSFTELKALNYP